MSQLPQTVAWWLRPERIPSSEQQDAQSPAPTEAGSVSLWRWLLRPESVPSSRQQDAQRSARPKVGRVSLWRWLLRPDPLPTVAAPGQLSKTKRSKNLLVWLIGGEQLPVAPVPPPEADTQSTLGWLVSRDSLPAANPTIQDPALKGLFGWLLSRDSLPDVAGPSAQESADAPK